MSIFSCRPQKDGSVAVWDLRTDGGPVQLFSSPSYTPLLSFESIYRSKYWPQDQINPALGLTLDYGIDCQYEPDSGRLYLISGSNEADSLQLCQVLQGGHSEIVRSTCWDPKRGILFSGGEDAKLGLWTSTASTTTPSPLVASASSNKAHHCSLSRSARSNPY
ncbi:hypothetical protein BCR41DRAFT_356698 [Lobosporangium transversale]|uniref:Uncharacterized protein n=1 Tax=Lobosporangium transversale TaxID=64571 RepID=A0A1Y2GKF8_9FUNG|nr:hypothetical protein BCR41DRAFT_356698 [Lobosporangium transversale]ORZ11647.1 hypothetical protein BCR41DRAFT_356698 [Lobosporangium transversale]|eukprot:XP_021879744.1 hypothetical protein BCR41DRAFT_356698 [Lobosporangium transversale]